MIPREDHLFGLLAVQTGLVDPLAFLDVWASLVEGGPALPDLLVQRGLLVPEDREHLAYLVRRKMPAAQATAPTIVTVTAPAGTDRYRYLDLCGTGGMGNVWRARDTRLDRDVAIKELKRDLAGDEIIRFRFLREARITGQLDHPGIVPVHDLLPSGDGQLRYAMRLLRGRTLSEAIRHLHQRRQGEDVSLERAGLLQAFVAVCNTVGYAHSRGVLHRDLKPANILLGDFGEVVVLDWGLAGPARTGPLADQQDDHRATLPGHVFGTPEYMAPEQASGDIDRVDQRSDIYGLGAILYQLLTGVPPFSGSSLCETLALVREREPTPVRERCPDVPAGLEVICHKALSKRPEDRYAAATDLAAAVLQWQESERREAERALRESEERFRTLFEAVPQSLWIARPDGWIEFYNRKGRQLAGEQWAVEQFLGLGWKAFVHPDDVALQQQAWERAQLRGEPYEAEFRWRLRDGSYRWVLQRAVPLRDAAGRIVQWFGSGTDIHDLKMALRQRDEALEQLRAQEAEYRAILDLIPHIVWTSTGDGNSFLNRRWYEYTGRSRQESAGGGLWMHALHEDDRQRTWETWSACLSSGEPFEIEYRLLGADGNYRWFLGRGVPFRDETGRTLRWFGTCTDIHERKQGGEG